MKKKIDKVMDIIYNDSNYKEIKEVDRDLDDSIISIVFKDGSSIVRSDAERIIHEYKSMEKEVNNFIDDNNLDDIENYDKILANFENLKDYFESGQAVLIEFPRYIKLVYNNYIK